MFALAIVPIIGLVGAAVDYSRGNAARTAMQASLDATALMLSRDAAGMDPAQVTAKATSFFNAQFNRPEVAKPAGHRGADQPAAGQLHPRRHGERHRADDVHQAARPEQARHQLLDAGEVGREEARARAGARQHRLDGEQRQDDGSSRPRRRTCSTTLAERRQAARRRQGRDHPVRQDREYRHRLRGQRLRSTTRCTTSSRRSGRAACRTATSRTTRSTRRRPRATATKFPAVHCSGITTHHAADRHSRHHRLHQPQQQDRRDESGRQHQRDDRPGLGLARADQERADDRRARIRRPTRTR